jgi:hypothetical protein
MFSLTDDERQIIEELWKLIQGTRTLPMPSEEPNVLGAEQKLQRLRMTGRESRTNRSHLQEKE